MASIHDMVREDLPKVLEGTTPELMVEALFHIAKTAAASRSSTRRVRWIQARAEGALRGQIYSDETLHIPRDAGLTTEKIRRQNQWLKKVNRQLCEVLKMVQDSASGQLDESTDQAIAWALEQYKDTYTTEPSEDHQKPLA